MLLHLAKALRPNSLLKALSGAAVLWRFLPDDHSDAATIHQTFCQEVWREGGTTKRIILVLGFVFWAPTFVVFSMISSWRCGARVRRDTDKGLLRQVWEQIQLAMRYAVPPPWYYIFELYDDDRRARAGKYIYRFETKRSLYLLLREQLSSPETMMALSDKAAFALRCQANAVPVVAALAKVIDRIITRLDGVSDGLPHQDLFLKPIHGTGGKGASQWRYEKRDGNYYGTSGASLSEAGLMDHVQRLSETEGYVIRALATNHPQIADLSPGALSTIRVMTCLDEQGHPEVTHAVLRMASNGDVLVDNFHAGGIAACIDIRTGRLGPATDMGLRPDSRWWESHPTTGGQILGRTVPFWGTVKDVACRAHRAFSDHVLIGWDIALVDGGPVLVEGNKGPDLDIIQRIYQEPAGTSRLGHLLVFHLGRALEKKYGSGARTARYGWPVDTEESAPP